MTTFDGSGERGPASVVLDAVDRALRAVPGGRLFVGFSGGLDSAVLLHAVAGLIKAARESAEPTTLPLPEELLALHADHGLHVDSAGWRQRCLATCEALAVPCRWVRLTVAAQGSVEANARRARYEFFAAQLAPGDTLWLAHHQNDQVETALLHLLQGRGFYGMPTTRELGAGRIDRPLLRLPRAALEAYARQFSLSWIEDTSNRDPSFDRNFLRLEVLPALRVRWSGLDQRLISALDARDAAERALLRLAGFDAERNWLPCANLLAMPVAERAAVLRLWLMLRDRAGLAQEALMEFARQLAAAPDAQPRLNVPAGQLRRFGERIYLVPELPPLQDRYEVRRPGLLRLPHGELEVTTARAGEAGVVLRGGLWLGFRDGGERIRVNQHQRRLKHLLQTAAMPPWQRESYPLLFDDLGLAAVPGIALRDAPDDSASGETRWMVSWRPA